MNKLINWILDYIWIVFIILGILFLASGCSLFQSQTPIPIDSGKNLLLNTVQKSNVPVWLCIFIIGGGTVALFNGAIKLGGSAMLFGFTTLTLGLATARFGFAMSVLGLIGTIASIAYSILVKNGALKQIIKGIEVLKNTWEGKEENLANVKAAVSSTQNSTQTKTTKKIVQKVKAELKGKK